MVGPVISSPAQTGQVQNSNVQQQVEATKGPAQAEQRDPRPDEVQRRDAPAAQSQQSAEQNSRAPRPDESSSMEFSASASSAEQSEMPETESRGELVDLTV